jgi:phenylacetyl-CoA:acceptor oxidoreductase
MNGRKAMADQTTAKPRARKMVPVYCNQCVCGPDLFKVEVENGVALRIEPNLELDSTHPAHGRVCVKAYGLIQKTYNPNRITRPMKRTNPKKGRAHDPGLGRGAGYRRRKAECDPRQGAAR